VRAIRTRLLAVVAGVVAVSLLAITVAFNLVLERRLDGDATNVARARAASVLTTLDVTGRRVREREAANDNTLDAQIWIFANGGLLERPDQASPALNAAARALAGAEPGRGGARARAPDVRLYALPISTGGARRGTVVAGVALGPYRRSARDALLASIVIAALTFAGMLALTTWLLRRALDPVVAMTRRAAEWSVSDPDRRFARGTPYDELTELAATLDQLLGRLAGSLRREQRFSAELSHELRTPLARIAAEAELALARDRDPQAYRDALAVIQRSAAQMRETIDALLAAARHEASGGPRVAEVRGVVAAALDRCALLIDERELDAETAVGEERVAVEPELAERILGPIVENACQHAQHSMRVAAARAGERIVITVEDDGPGVAPEDAERIFEPGVRVARTGERGGAGLGLALARRLARAAAGDVRADARSAGARFEIELPAS
jgi:signal transduction histidine kinase